MEDPQVQAVLLKIQNAQSTREIFELTLVLDKIMMGEFSLSEDPRRADELHRARANAVARDVDDAHYRRDSQGFIDQVYNDAEQVKLTGEAAERAKARATQMLSDARAGRLATQINKKLRLDQEIEHGPKVDVVGQGQWLNIGPHDSYKPTLMPDIVRIMHREWEIRPGLNQNVPEVFAKRYQEILRGRAESSERERVMNVEGGSIFRAGRLNQALMKIDKAYGIAPRTTIE